MRVERLAADANVLLSAVLGHAAARVFVHGGIEVVTVEPVLRDVREYLPVLGAKYGIALPIVEHQLALLAVRTCRRAEYARALPEAARRLADRDPDDAELLACALALDATVWSNDRDFASTGTPVITTARLLARLGIRGKPGRGRAPDSST